MDSVEYLKKIVLLSLVLIFSGCRFLVKSQEVITMNEFEEMVEGKFKNVADVVKLFPKSVADVEKRVEFATEMVKKELDQILSLKADERSFKNTAYAFDKLEAKFGVAAGAIQSFEMISPDENIIKACHQAAIKLNEFAVDAFMNRQIYKAFKEYVDGNIKKEKLNSEEKYFIDETMRDFKRQGFDLPDEEFEKVKELNKQISKLGLEFEKNVNFDKSSIEVTLDGLKGLEQHFIDNLKKTDDGKYILRCDYPTYFEIRENCAVESTRKDLYFAFMNRAYPKNMEILDSLIEKRDELAKVIGFESFASLNLDSQMVKTPQRARMFLQQLAEKTMKKADKEFAQLAKDLPEGVALDQNSKMSPWDLTYVQECYKKKHFNIDEREIAKYFPVENTLEKVFEIYQKFLGLEFRFVDVDNLWHKDAKAVQIYDKNSDKLKGTLLLDLYPRDNKFPHACMIDLVLATKKEDPAKGKIQSIPAVILVIANFPKATKDRPALLKYDDVRTFFHEFGHTMHGFLGQTEMSSFSGTNVKRDFVEMPSQMFEEWMWDKDILKMVSKHYETNEPLPDELIDKMIALKKFDSGYWVTRQLWLSFIALDYFARGAQKDTDKIKKELHEKYIKHVRFEPDSHFQASFGHLIGYGAKYYGYMWARVFSLDMFDKIKKHGLLDSKIGKELEREVLDKGGSVEPDVLLKNFLGREPKQDAFLREYGII